MTEHASDNPAGMRDQRALIDAAWRQVEQARSTQAGGSEGDDHRTRRDRWRVASLPDSIPGYRLVDEIHRGGQGVVYRGVQASTGRTVAVKVMHGGPFAGPHERARFEREVQILAQLKHPNIVTIHDSGTADHAAFFVMDYIDGVQLDEYARRSGLALRERLLVFAKICTAVNVAHLRGVIHRDLKPGNIRIDDLGEPHVLDFGLAKHSAWDGASAVTVTGQFVGSLPWASPEQAEGQLADIDLRTDVYSLGVMLYQLLTGGFPYEVSGSLTETVANIVHADPKSPRALNASLDDEVATIVLKALHKDRNLRYQTAGSLGQDIERYLAGEPIEAKRDSMTYILRKQLALHKAAVSVAGAFAFLITVGLVVSLSLWRDAALARDNARAQERAAQNSARLAEQREADAVGEAAKAEAVSTFLTDMLGAASPEAGGTPDITVRETVDLAARRLDQGALAGKGELEAAVRRVVGTTYTALGRYDTAIHHLEKARARFALLTGEGSDETVRSDIELAGALRLNGDHQAADDRLRGVLALLNARGAAPTEMLAECLYGLAKTSRDREDLAKAEGYVREALAVRRGLCGEDCGADAAVAGVLNDLALVLQDRGDPPAAREVQAEAVAVFTAAHGREHYATAVAISNLATMCVAAGEFEEGERLSREALASFRASVGDKHPAVATALSGLGNLKTKLRDYAAAEGLLRECLTIRREVLGGMHPAIATVLNNLAIVRYQLGDFDGAVEAYNEALPIFRDVHGADHPSLATVMSNLAAIMRAKGDVDGAIPILRETLAIRRKHFGDDHPLVAGSLHNLGKTLMDVGAFDEADALLRASIELREVLFEADHPELALGYDALGGLRRAQGRLDEAETLTRRALDLRLAKFGEDSLDVADTRNNLAGILADAGDYEAAEPLYREAVASSAALLPEDHWRIATMRSNWGGALLHLERYEESEGQLLESAVRLTETQGDAHARTQRAIGLLVELYDRWEKPDQAEIWRDRRTGSAEPDGSLPAR